MAQKTISIAMLNGIRTSASPLYQEYVPVATQTNIAEVGAKIFEYDPKLEEFSGLLRKIIKSFTIKRLFENPFKRFKSETLSLASDLEEYFVKKIASKAFDPTGSTTLAPHYAEVAVNYYRENRDETYATTISHKQFKKAFTSASALDAYIQDVIGELTNSNEIDEYSIFKEVLGNAGSDATLVEVTPITDEASAKAFIKRLKKVSNDFVEPSSDYHSVKDDDGIDNDPKIITNTPKANQVLFLNKDVEAEVDVEVIAKAFQGQAVKYPVSEVIIGDFGTIGGTKKIVAILADERAIQIRDLDHEVTTQVNAQGRFTNYFLNVEQQYGISPFANMAVFVEKEEAVVPPVIED